MIDLHAHFVPPELIRALERKGPHLEDRALIERGNAARLLDLPA